MNAATSSAPSPHAQILADAAAISASGGRSYAEIDRRPALRTLIQQAVEAIEAAMPASILHEGRRYFLCVRVDAVELGIHCAADDPAPLVRVLTEGGKWCGHRPGRVADLQPSNAGTEDPGQVRASPNHGRDPGREHGGRGDA